MSHRVLALTVGCMALSFHPVHADLYWHQNGSPLDELTLVEGESVTVQLYNDDPVARYYDVTLNCDAPWIADVVMVTPLYLAGDWAFANDYDTEWWLHCEWNPAYPQPISVWGNHWDVTIQAVAPGGDTLTVTDMGFEHDALPVTVLPRTPVLMQAVSSKTHGPYGTWDIPVGIGDTESRSAQLGTGIPNQLTIIAAFDIPVAVLGGAAAVQTDVGTVAAVTQTNLQEVMINMTDVPFCGQVNLSFNDGVNGVVNVDYPTDPAYASDSTLCIRVVVGDYDNDGRVNFIDFSKARFTECLNRPVTSLNCARWDFDCSGIPGFMDMFKVKNSGLINKAAPPCPEPPIGP